MAVPTSFPESNAVLDKPPSMTYDECEAIAVLQCVGITDGLPRIISCWKITADEMAEVVRTGRIWVTVSGAGMPPIAVSGTKPEIEGEE